MCKRFYKGMACAAVLGIFAGVGFSSPAHALKLTLKRAVFEGSHRAEVLTIINNSDKEEAYRIGWRPMRMSEDQSLVTIAEGEEVSGLQSADHLVRFAPRRIVVPAGGSQQIRLMLNKPQDLAPGEYRSHLWLQPEAENVRFDQSAASDTPKVQLKMLTGMTIPVIVRHGETTVKATLSDGSVHKPQGSAGLDVSFTLHRQGNRSLYGALRFLCGGTLVREIKGIAIYTEIHQRHLKYNVPYAADSCPVMTVQYFADPDDLSLKGALLASTDIAVP